MIKATIRGFFYFLHLQKRRMGILKRFFSKEKLDKGLEPTKQSLVDKIGKARSTPPLSIPPKPRRKLPTLAYTKE